MKGLDTAYIGNLEHFLQHSDEDEADSQFFLEKFSEMYMGSVESLKWLDVGAGPGTKPIKILNGTNNYKGLLGQFKNITLDIVEPSGEWQNILLRNFRKENLEEVLGRKCQTTWEEHKPFQKYGLMTFFHSVYGIKTESLRRIPHFLKENGWACIVVESPDSDLHLIKKSIFPYIHHQELLSSSNTITNFFEQEGIKHMVDVEESKQKFYVNEILDVDNPDRVFPLSFILQTRPEDHNKLVSQKVQEKIDTELKKYVKVDERGKSFINVPDRFIWVCN